MGAFCCPPATVARKVAVICLKGEVPYRANVSVGLEKGSIGFHFWRGLHGTAFCLRHYYSSIYMQGVLKRSRSIIFSAILKHGLDNFSLTIVEYCLPEEQFKREDYYLTKFKPGYNILKKANSSLGMKHTEEAKLKMRELKRKHPEAQAIEVKDLLTNEINNYDSILAVGKALNIHQATISKYFSSNQKKPYKGRYVFKKINK